MIHKYCEWQFYVPPLHCAAKCGFLKLCKLLISAGHDVRMTDTEGNTPLHYAAYNGHIEICKLLITVGADVNKKNEGRLERRGNSQFLHIPVHVSKLRSIIFTLLLTNI